MSTQPNNKTFVPKDLTPIERARLKAIALIAIAVLLNAVLMILAALDQFQTITARDLFVSVAISVVMALAETARKYFTASGELPFSMLLSMAENEIPASPVKLSANEQAVQQAFTNIVQPQVNAALNDARGIQAPAPVNPQAVPVVPASVQLLNTIPNIAKISNPQQG
jgi:hypothetical protein